MPPTFDERDADILAERQIALDRIPGVRVGDFLRFPDGTEKRVTDVRDYYVQTAPIGSGSYYLRPADLFDGEGGVNYSGSLEPGIRRQTVREDVYEQRMGSVWFFHRNQPQAHNAVTTEARFRIFEVQAPQE